MLCFNWDIIGLLATVVFMGCLVNGSVASPLPYGDAVGMDRDNELVARRAMLQQLKAYRITDEHILQAMGKIRRHVFIPKSFRDKAGAYGDHPCPIGYGQTISQPYIVAYMTLQLDLKPHDKVLEIGTGSGYQAAVLAECGASVYSIEIIPELARHARETLDVEGYSSVQIMTGDGYKGWPEHSPFDAIIVTCAPDEVPQPLVDQLKEGGRMIVPVGAHLQRLVVLQKKNGQVTVKEDLPVRFVPMLRGSSNAPSLK